MLDQNINTIDVTGRNQVQSLQEIRDRLNLAFVGWVNYYSLAKNITVAIREVDSETPIIINSLNWGGAAWFSVMQPIDDGRTNYSPIFTIRKYTQTRQTAQLTSAILT